jgi:hypothetical protein
MSKHTPGPWKAVYVGCGDWDLTGPVTQEDWTLAAAAPDLLAFVEEYMEAWEGGMAGDSYLARIARSAIAKAIGERT